MTDPIADQIRAALLDQMARGYKASRSRYIEGCINGWGLAAGLFMMSLAKPDEDGWRFVGAAVVAGAVLLIVTQLRSDRRAYDRMRLGIQNGKVMKHE
jgi:hypothetical protein